MACWSVSDPAVVVVLVIGLLVSLRVVASATRGKDGRARPERTPPRRKAGKILNITAHKLDQTPAGAANGPQVRNSHGYQWSLTGTPPGWDYFGLIGVTRLRAAKRYPAVAASGRKAAKAKPFPPPAPRAPP